MLCLSVFHLILSLKLLNTSRSTMSGKKYLLVNMCLFLYQADNLIIFLVDNWLDCFWLIIYLFVYILTKMMKILSPGIPGRAKTSLLHPSSDWRIFWHHTGRWTDTEWVTWCFHTWDCGRQFNLKGQRKALH